ncbi:hypothetical protein Y032_0034g2844 [Ancylostoma ceylanicum]|uniref:SCP domain-containing protein n=1 Tax=Ancylostoma ceylanicum TaxID=53326 RepID=A0A016UMN4_9BILA|nr:hypothetical protein Y032_0034g2844 [Ancylostoma ceylanicum]
MTFRFGVVLLVLCSPSLTSSWDFDNFPKGCVGALIGCDWLARYGMAPAAIRSPMAGQIFLHHPKCKKLSYSCELEAYATGAAVIDDGKTFINETFPLRNYYYLEYEGKDPYDLFEEAARKWADDFKKMRRKDIFGCSGYLNGTDNKVVCIFGKA